MVVDRKTAEYVAELSRLKISEDEIESVCNELSSILNYMDEINSTIDTGSVSNSIKGLTNVMREDEIHDSMDRAQLLENTPVHTDETPVVPKTVD
ncbi:MAG: Asp-tRNA(Asn)/Glu-tRNA(Gln) amidotransferase subunit GatC [Lachnospiraceae bacterium]|nr:Asp-tRNA(Asn)/Glu-tRNA(Gln) amidotransferase subunit GatC [Lachnospiraceae bacterium]